MGAPGRRGGERAKPPEIRGVSPLPAAHAGQDGAGGLPPRAGPDRWEKYTGTAGFWPRGGGGQPRGAGAQNQSARGAGRRGRASPARRPGPVGKVYRYGRVLAAGRGRAAAGGGGAKSVSARGRTARAGFPRAQARTDGKSMPVRQGFGRRGAGARGRGRKISQRARDGGRTWSGGSIIVQAGGIPAAGRGVDSRGARGGQN